MYRAPPSPRPFAAPAGVAILLVTLFGGLPRTAAAQLTLIENSGSAETSAAFSGTSLPAQTDEATFGPTGGAAVAEVTPFGNRVRAAQTGSGFNAVSAEGRLPGDISSFHYLASTELDWGIENTGPTPATLIFDFVLNGGEVRLFDPTSRFRSMVARVGVDVFVIGPGASGFLWSWILTLRESFGTLTAEFDFISDPLGLGLPAISPITVSEGEAAVSIAPLSASFDLGTLGAGGRATIHYSMFAEVSGPALRGGEGGRATLGDPFDVEGNPGAAISFRGVTEDPTVVPEPGSLLLLSLGLSGLGALRRRRVRSPAP